MKKLIVLFAVLVIISCSPKTANSEEPAPNSTDVLAQEPPEDSQSMPNDFSVNFSTSREAAVITGYTGKDGTIIIPSTVEGVPVTVIGEKAFSGSTTLNSITIPDGITTIVREAFLNCQNLNSVTIPDSVALIGYGAFSGCTNLETVNFSNNAKIVFGYGVFKDCAKLSLAAQENLKKLGYEF